MSNPPWDAPTSDNSVLKRSSSLIYRGKDSPERKNLWKKKEFPAPLSASLGSKQRNAKPERPVGFFFPAHSGRPHLEPPAGQQLGPHSKKRTLRHVTPGLTRLPPKQLEKSAHSGSFADLQQLKRQRSERHHEKMPCLLQAFCFCVLNRDEDKGGAPAWVRAPRLFHGPSIHPPSPPPASPKPHVLTERGKD